VIFPAIYINGILVYYGEFNGEDVIAYLNDSDDTTLSKKSNDSLKEKNFSWKNLVGASKILIIIFMDINYEEGTNRILQAFQASEQFMNAGVKLKIIFDGKGVNWFSQLLKENRCVKKLNQFKERIEGIYSDCLDNDHIKNFLESYGIKIMNGNMASLNIEKYIDQGFSVLTF
jgi:hypothetical protein